MSYVASMRAPAEVSTVPSDTLFGTGVQPWMHEVARLILAVGANAALLRDPKTRA